MYPPDRLAALAGACARGGVEGSSNVHGGNARNVPAILIHDVKLQTRRSKTFVGLVVTISGESDKATG